MPDKPATQSCPNCNHNIEDADVLSWAGRINGRRKTKKSAKASAKNGKLGGRPAKKKKQGAKP